MMDGGHRFPPKNAAAARIKSLSIPQPNSFVYHSLRGVVTSSGRCCGYVSPKVLSIR